MSPPPEPLGAILPIWERFVAHDPGRELLAAPAEGARFTRVEADLALRRLAGWLDARAVPPGGRILVDCARPLDSLLVAYAAMWSGRVPVLVPGDAPDTVREDLAARLEAALVLTTGPRPGWVALGSDAWFDELAAATPRSCLGPIDPEADAAILLTSGSTGRAKAVRLSHRALHSSQVRYLGLLRQGTPRSGLATSPHTITGFRVALLLPFLNGGSSVLLSPRASPLEVLRAAVDEGVTALTVGPLFVSSCLSLLDEVRAIVAGSSVRRVLGGGAPLTVHQRATFVARTGLVLEWSYGLTETAGTFCLSTTTPEGLAEPGAGRPLARIDLLDRAGAPVPVGEVGEVVVTTSGAFNGYIGETEKRSATEPIHTHDLGRVDAEGFLHIHGRSDRVVADAVGNKVLLDEIEEALRAVTGTAAYALAAPGGGIAAWVEAPGHHGRAAEEWAAQVRVDLRRLLPPRAIPRILEAVDHLPLTANGKVDQAAILRRLQGR